MHILLIVTLGAALLGIGLAFLEASDARPWKDRTR